MRDKCGKRHTDAMRETVLTAHNISFAYDERRVLDDLSLTVERGEFVGLIGANGSGKTTLMRVLLGFLTVPTGEIRLKGDSLKDLSRREIAVRATLVQQDTRIDFDFTAREIVAMGRTPYLGRFTPERAADKEIIERAMTETETAVFAARLITELSGGERQRVHLARAIAQETDLILLDEPTANLDLTHQFEALRLIKKLARAGKTAIAAIHDLSLAARFCDRIVLLADGKIAADGTPEAVITEENLRRHFALRARIRTDEESGGLIIYPLGSS